MTQRIVWGCFVFGFAGCFQKTGFRVSHPRGTPSARDDTVYGLMWSVSGLCVVMWLQKTGSRVAARDDTAYSLGVLCFWISWLFSKDWIPVQPPQRGPVCRDDTVYGLMWSVSGLCVVMWLQKTGSRFSHPRGAPSARDDTVLGSGGTCFGGAFPTFHHSTSHRSCRSCHPRSISFSPPHHAITSPRSHHSTSPPLHLS